jgi:two-component system sensor histidine kinase QseC
MTSSLRGRLLLGTSLAGIVVLGLLGISLYAAMRHALLADFDASLRTEARIVAGMVDQDGAKIGFEFDPRQTPDFVTKDRARFFEVWRDDGTVLARSPSLDKSDLPKTTLDNATTDKIGDADLPGGNVGRAVTVSYQPIQQEQDDNQPRIPTPIVTIVVAGEPLEAQHTLRTLAGLLALLCAAAVIVMAIIQFRVVGQSVRPIEKLATEIEALRENDLGRRFAVDEVPGELKPVLEKLNGLLARLEQAFAREKSFTADVAHELRTPIAGLRATLEVCRSRPREPAAYESALDDCRGITDRMEAMVQSLLLLARSEAGQVSVEKQPIDLCKLVRENWDQFQYRAERRGVKITLQLPDDCITASDAGKLQIVLQNIFDNAVSYVNDGGDLRISIRAGSTAARTNGAGAKSNGAGAKAHGAGAKSHGAGAKAHGVGAKAHGAAAKSNGAGAKSHDAGAKSHDAGAKSNSTGANVETDSVRPAGDFAAEIEVANTGSEIDAADGAHVFERFWRGDAARTDAGLHCGLGLSLTRRLMTLLGGEISVQTTRGGEFVVKLTLPG